MADDADLADLTIAQETDYLTNKARHAVATMPIGNPGVCEICDVYSLRLVHDNCAPCRDKYGLE
jgi:hypothetical protein